MSPTMAVDVPGESQRSDSECNDKDYCEIDSGEVSDGTEKP